MEHRDLAAHRGYASKLANIYGQAWPPPGMRATKSAVRFTKREGQGWQSDAGHDVVLPVHDGDPDASRTRVVTRPGGDSVCPVNTPRDKIGVKMDLSSNLSSKIDDAKCNLSQADYKKLLHQVREVSLDAGTGLRGTGYKKYFYPQASQDQSTVYKSQLSASVKAFKNKKWTPLDPPPPEETNYFHCRSLRHKTSQPLSKPLESRCSTPGVMMNASVRASKLQRPQSVPASALYRRSESPTDFIPADSPDGALVQADTRHYDTLTPDVLSELSQGYIRDSWYGERPFSALSGYSGMNKTAKDSDLSSTSGLGSDKDSDKESDRDDVVSKDSDLSDDEDIPEPSVDKARSVPELNLRPEKLDSMYIPEGRRGLIKYDFDAQHVDVPAYEFACALPEEVKSLNLRVLCTSERNWRHVTKVKPKDPIDVQIIDRLIEIERLQIQTEDWEAKRNARTRHLRQNKLTLSRLSSATSRAQSARSRDRKCCMGCLQPACTGDCPDRGARLYDNTPAGNERPETPYDLHTRSNRADSESSRPRKRIRPKSCTHCQRRHNAKLINANNVVLGRPRSSYATYSRGQASRIPRDMRPQTPVISDGLEKNFEELGIESYRTRDDASYNNKVTKSDATQKRMFKGRAATIPGKSYFSNRRYSLTCSNVQARVNTWRKNRPKSSKRHKVKAHAY